METEITTSHPSSPIYIAICDNGKLKIGDLTLLPFEVLELRNFLNQLELGE